MIRGTVTAVDGREIEVTFPMQLQMLFKAHLEHIGRVDYTMVIAQTVIHARLYAGNSVAQGRSTDGQLYAVTHRFI